MECLEKVTVVKLVCQRDVYMAHPRSPPGRDPPGRPVRAPPRHGCLHRHHGPGHRLGRLDAATVVTTGSRFFSSTAGLVPRPVHTAVVISTAARAIYATVVVTVARAGSLTVSSLLVPPPPSRDTCQLTSSLASSLVLPTWHLCHGQLTSVGDSRQKYVVH